MIKSILRKLFWGFFRHFLPDKPYALFRYRLEFGRRLNLDPPQTFSEKIQYLKLHERTELRKKVADRVAVREYVAEKAGEGLLIPLIGVYDELDRKTWETLPSRFVLKANHGCEMVRIMENKEETSFEEIRALAQSWQKTDYYRLGREWVYKDLPRTLVAEQLLVTAENSIPDDYKFFCFHGRVKLIQMDFDRFEEKQTRNFYDRDFNRLDVKRTFENYPGEVPHPPRLEEAIRIAETLAAGFNFIRVDLFLPDDRIFFGELTNYPGGGFARFTPDSFDLELGKWLRAGADADMRAGSRPSADGSLSG